MKLKNLFFALLTMSIIGSGCSKDDDSSTPYTCASCASTPTAVAANNSSSKGIYKGVVTASSGTITFNIANTGNTITAVLILNGQTINLTATTTWDSTGAYISPFTGMLNGQPVVINFEVGADGSGPMVTTSSIPGHPNAEFTIVKELSTSLIEGFEGTYSINPSGSGIFNLLISRSGNIWGGSSRETGDTTSEGHSGSIVDNKLMEDGVHVGTLNGDNITGTFVNSSSETVTVVGRRTL